MGGLFGCAGPAGKEIRKCLPVVKQGKWQGQTPVAASMLAIVFLSELYKFLLFNNPDVQTQVFIVAHLSVQKCPHRFVENDEPVFIGPST